MNRKDLVVLVADKDMEQALKGLLVRPEALNIRAIRADIFVHPQHDPACAQHGVAFLSRFAEQYHYGLLMFDHEGSGREPIPIQELQAKLNHKFQDSPWTDRARVIILSPELETWVWADSPHVDDVIGWKGKTPTLRQWLIAQGWLQQGQAKPDRPKEAFEAALRETRTPRSSSLYQQIANSVSLRRCQDTSFLEFQNILRNWFGNYISCI